jgi:hypothetical protein
MGAIDAVGWKSMSGSWPPDCPCAAECCQCEITGTCPPRDGWDPSDPWFVTAPENGGSLFLAPCGANTPVLPNGACDEEGGEPCKVCGGPLP